MRVTIWGASDDVLYFATSDDGDLDEIDALGDRMHRGYLNVKAPDDEAGVNVHVIYDGCWSFSVCPDDGDVWPEGYDFDTDWGGEEDRSVTLSLVCPDGASITPCGGLEE